LRRLLTLLALAGAFVSSASAHADSFRYSIFSDTGAYTGEITITGPSVTTGNTAFGITSASGSINGNNISLAVMGEGNANLFFVDDVLFAGGLPPGSGLIFDEDGLLLTDGTNLYNFFEDNGEMVLIVWTPENGASAEMPVSLASVPEPSAFALCGTGILALAGVAKRRFQIG
jgi:hypothetical protein